MNGLYQSERAIAIAELRFLHQQAQQQLESTAAQLAEITALVNAERDGGALSEPDWSLLTTDATYRQRYTRAMYKAMLERPRWQSKPVCGQCRHWRDHYQGYCGLRAEVELPQLPQSHAARCHFFSKDCPF